MIYKIALGWDVPLDELADVVPQPRNGEVQIIERRYSDDGPVDVGPFSQPIFDMFGTDAELQGIYTQFGLLDADEARVTWYTRDDTFAWYRYNGVAVKPRPVDDGGARRDYFLRGYSIVIKELVQLVEP